MTFLFRKRCCFAVLIATLCFAFLNSGSGRAALLPSVAVTKIRFFPRAGNAGRMRNGHFAGSNETATTGFTTLATITRTPVEGKWSEITLPAGGVPYRFLKYDSPARGWGNVAELEFYAGSKKLSGTRFGTAGSRNAGGATFARALDGNTATYFDAASADDQYVGIDLGAANQVVKPQFHPTSGTYAAAQRVILSTSTAGAKIRYSLNGSEPSSTGGTVYTGPLAVGSTTTVKAVAYKAGLADSPLAAATFTIGGSAPVPNGAKVSRIYHIGNSVTDALSYSGLKTMVESRNGVYDFGRDMIPGAPLEWIWQHPTDGFGEPPYKLYPTALPGYRWDCITLQPFDRHLDSDVPMALNFIRLSQQFPENSRTQFYIYSRWPRKRADGSLPYQTLWLRPYTGGWDNTEETKDYFEKMLIQLRSQTPFLSKPILIVPAGDVLFELDRRMKAGQIPGYTDVSQLYSDGIHMNNIGSFVVGTTFYATLYKTDPRGASAAGYGSIPSNVVQAIQQCVWDVVRTHPYSGVNP